ncbi:endoribonuclease L-PSP [Salinisphaera sp. PC39]
MSATGMQSVCAGPLAWRPETARSALAVVDFARDTDSGLHLPLPFLGGTLRAESWLAAGPPETGEVRGLRYAAADGLCHLRIRVERGPDDAVIGEDVYRRLLAARHDLDCPHLLRVWHYLGRINVGEGDDENYKRFCVGRARALEDHPDALERLPAATLVGAAENVLELHALIGREPPRPIENPRQVSAYDYPRQYGPRQPTFARAAAVGGDGGRPQLLVSGTASIVGHATRHVGDPAAQARESLANIDAVLAAAAPIVGPVDRGDLDCLKVYVRHAEDAPRIMAEVAAGVPAGVPVAYLKADLCRSDLLVEMETQVTRR